ncbi:MAG: ABC transporter permease [Acidobacteria bacterium]|nr:ABC transporter permease [Acidobacteriota bacterium]
MRTLRFVAAEAWEELRAGCRGPLIPVVFVGLIAYMLLMLANAEIVRSFGATGVPRNSPQLVYTVMAAQAFWVLFIWAWVFGRAVLRDRTARLHELVLSAPVSLPLLLLGRYLGAAALGCVLASSTVLAFLLVPLVYALGLLPPDSAGPAPYLALGHSLLVLTVPSALGSGALFLCAAIRARSMTGPFVVAAGMLLFSMVSMVVLRGGDMNPAVATMLDPAAQAEVEEQTDRWTPLQKRTGVLAMTAPLAANRVIWTLPPLLLLGVVLRRLDRERLVLERAPAGGHRSAEEQAAADAAWESRWWAEAAPLRLAGGAVDVVVDAGARRATALWRLDGVRSASGVLHGSLPPGSSDPRAAVEGREAAVTVAFDHFSVPLGACGAQGSRTGGERRPRGRGTRARREAARRSAGGGRRRGSRRGAPRRSRLLGRLLGAGRACTGRRRKPLALARRRVGAGHGGHPRDAAVRGRRRPAADRPRADDGRPRRSVHAARCVAVVRADAGRQRLARRWR